MRGGNPHRLPPLKLSARTAVGGSDEKNTVRRGQQDCDTVRLGGRQTDDWERDSNAIQGDVAKPLGGRADASV